MRSKRRIALVCQSSLSSWVSCRTITKNLKKSYRLGFPEDEIQEFRLDRTMTSFEIFQEVERLHAFAPTLLSFIDHTPHPWRFIRAVAERFGLNSLPEFVVHVFGDFTLCSGEWLALSSILESARTRWVCASPKQANMVQGLMNPRGTPVASIPFPVDREDFSFGPTSRLTQDGFVFLYSGRISHQKNVLRLISAFSKFLEIVEEKASLWIAGPADDIAYPYLGEDSPEGALSHDIQSMIEKEIDPRWKGRVTLFGELDQVALRDLYLSADAFVSFSTHNDEDFGMAPAEAACSGLPLLLSDWAGYSGFSRLGEDHCRLVPVKFTENRVHPTWSDCLDGLIRASIKKKSPEDRAALSKATLAWVSCEAVAAELRAWLDSPPIQARGFVGFSLLMRELAQAYQNHPKAPFAMQGEFSPLYRRIYEPYA